MCTQRQTTDAQLYSSGWTYPLRLTPSATTYSSTDSRLSSASTTLHVSGSSRQHFVGQHSSAVIPCDSVLDRCSSQPTWHRSANLSTRSVYLIIISPTICNCSSPWMLPTLYIGTRSTRVLFRRRPTVVSGKLPAVERRQVRRNGHFCSAAAVTTVDVADSPPPVASQIKSLGVIIDSYLRFDRQTTTVAKACSLTIIIHALRHVRKLLTDETACTVACSIAARLDYCNARR